MTNSRPVVMDSVIQASQKALEDIRNGMSDMSVNDVESGRGLSGDKQRVKVDPRFGQKDAVFPLGVPFGSGG